MDDQKDSTRMHDSGIDILSDKLDRITSDLKTKLAADDPQLKAGVRKFVGRCDKLAQTSTARLSSAFHMFGSVSVHTAHDTTTTSQSRCGRQIHIQASTAGRRRMGTS